MTPYDYGRALALEKTGAAPPREIMERVLSRVRGLPWHERASELSPKSLTKYYRSALRRGAGDIEVPLADRLKSYKTWKSTGRLPDVGTSEILEHSPHWSPEASPMSLVSGGTKEDFVHHTAFPRSPANHPVVIPGQTTAARSGSYMYPTSDPRHMEGARRYSRRAAGAVRSGEEFKTPAVLTATAPTRGTLRFNGEVFVPHNTQLSNVEF